MTHPNILKNGGNLSLFLSSFINLNWHSSFRGIDRSDVHMHMQLDLTIRIFVSCSYFSYVITCIFSISIRVLIFFKNWHIFACNSCNFKIFMFSCRIHFFIRVMLFFCHILIIFSCHIKFVFVSSYLCRLSCPELLDISRKLPKPGWPLKICPIKETRNEKYLQHLLEYHVLYLGNYKAPKNSSVASANYLAYIKTDLPK